MQEALVSSSSLYEMYAFLAVCHQGPTSHAIPGPAIRIENEATSTAFPHPLMLRFQNTRQGQITYVDEEGRHSEELKRSIHSVKAAKSRAMF